MWAPFGLKIARQIYADLRIGITFSPNGSYAYVTDTGAQYALFGYNFTAPASM